MDKRPNQFSKKCKRAKLSEKTDAEQQMAELQISPTRPTQYTSEDILALVISCRFTKDSYNFLRRTVRSHNVDIYPSYDVIKEAKRECYPDNLSVNGDSAEVTLQSLIDHTVNRLSKVQKNEIEQIMPSKLMMIYKWGCGGSSGDSTSYNDEHSTNPDESIFSVCVIPLQLKENDHIIWQNPCPSSTRFCRPIKILLKKESKELISQEIENVKHQISKIVPTKIHVLGNIVNVDHCFYLITIIDGKILCNNAETSSEICEICKADPKSMNDISKISVEGKESEKSLFEYGLSMLHAWIRCFECILHIAYRIKFKKWQAHGANKVLLEETKHEIISKLKSEMDLLIDIQKSEGCETTNDEYVARRFFDEVTLASNITGVNEELIHRFNVILKTMSCGYAINTEAFRKYTNDTAKLYVELYSWSYMPSIVHKILIHGADIVQFAALPIAIFSEEVVEVRNEDLERNSQEFHMRRVSPEKTIQKLFNRLLVFSDPIISTLLKISKFCDYDTENFCPEVKQLLTNPSEIMNSDDDDSDAENGN